MIVLNEPNEYYTFSGVRGQSDFNVILMDGYMAGCLFRWQVMNNWGISGVLVTMRSLYRPMN